MSILVSGASGELGAMVAAELCRRIDPADVILLSRTPERLAGMAGLGAKVRRADFGDPAGLEHAFAGADRALMISTLDVGPQRVEQHHNAIVAARRAGVRHLAYTSAVGIHPRNPSFIMSDHIQTEAMLADSGMAATILRIAPYADILARAIAPRAISTGRWISRSGHGRAAYVAKADCARVCTCILTGQGHGGATYEITGPELLSMADAARIAERMSGRTVALCEVEDDCEEVDGQARDWIGPFTREDLLSTEYAMRDGYCAILSDHVSMITGRAATPLAEVYFQYNLGGP